ncbi:flavin reductase family protein [Actinophytocola sp.]|uniref:flavin reductase family protein n=1 Tax=Actinophytocola sp. TaxID=1872138 RepID=UPI002ED594C7
MSEPTAILPFARRSDLSTSDCLAFYRKLAAGVTVVTAAGETGPDGATASAVTSVSLRPPLLLACLSTDSRTLAAIRARRVFAVHLLAEDQRHISTAFAEKRENRFADQEWEPVHGAPVLTATPAWAVCRVADTRHYGDHALVVGRLIAAHSGPGRPLLWHDRDYWRISEGS